MLQCRYPLIAVIALTALAAGAQVTQPPAPAAGAAAVNTTAATGVSTVKTARVIGWPAGLTPQAPPGLVVTAFARGLDNPRNILVLPNGDVLVAEARQVLSAADKSRLPDDLVQKFTQSAGGMKPSANRITLLRDKDGDGVADVQSVLIEDLNLPYGMALRRDRLYIANTDGVLACPFLVGQLRITSPCKQVIDLPAAGVNGHWTRNLIFSADETQLYIAVGSATNVDAEGFDAQVPQRAAILVAKPNGSDLRIHAAGLRNPVGLAFEPVSGRLWTTVNERDLLGDDTVPDYLTSVRAGTFHGWPQAYFDSAKVRHVDPRKLGQRPELVATAVAPDLPLGSHVAPLGLTFYRRDLFPSAYQGGAFIAERGSWNRSQFAGFRVVFVPFANGKPSGPPRDFLTGFLKDAESGEAYGRPAGVASTPDGALLVADDAGNTLWRVQSR